MSLLLKNMDDVCPTCHFPMIERDCINCIATAEQDRMRAHQKRADIILALGGERSYEEYILAGYIASGNNGQALEAVKVFDYSKDNMFIWSSYNDRAGSYGNGTGKTHLAAICLRRAMEAGANGMLLKPNGLFRLLRACEEPIDEINFLKRIEYLDVFVFDDIDAAKDSEYTMQTLYDVIDARYMRNLGGLIVTSNLGLDALEKRWRSARITSRLREMCGKHVYCLDGEPDHRKKI